MADRVGVINRGELILVEQKDELMRKLGKKQMTLELRTPLTALPPALAKYPLALADDGCKLIYTYDTRSEHTGITDLLDDLRAADVHFKDLATTQTSLEDIFVSLVRNGA
jgi:ABC-2 type transport system ATP-binding protein